MASFEDKVAIITGSATGLGASTALKLSASGARIILNYSKSQAECEATAQACLAAGAKDVRVVQGNVAMDEDCRKIAAAAEDWGQVDILVNNAGTTKHAPKPKLQAQW